VKFGTAEYVYAVAVLNFIIVALCCGGGSTALTTPTNWPQKGTILKSDDLSSSLLHMLCCGEPRHNTLLIEEAIAHHGSKGLTKFNYNDMKSVVVASSMGGPAIANRVVQKNREWGNSWIANPADDDVGTLRVKLVGHHEKGMALIMDTDDVPLVRFDTMTREPVGGSSKGYQPA
jgi:hypothetical protein